MVILSSSAPRSASESCHGPAKRLSDLLRQPDLKMVAGFDDDTLREIADPRTWRPRSRAHVDPDLQTLTELLTSEHRLTLEIVEKRPRLLVVGAGHCGCAPARAAVFSGYDVTVGDKRDGELDPALFPKEAKLIQVAPDYVDLRFPAPRTPSRSSRAGTSPTASLSAACAASRFPISA